MLSGLVQALLNGIVAGTVLAVPAIGFTAIFAVLRHPNFAIGAFVTVGAYAGWWANTALGLRMEAALLAAFAGAALVGLVVERFVLRAMAPGGALAVAIASLVAGLVVENVVRFAFGNDARGYDLPLLRDMVVGPVRIGPQQLENLAVALAVMAAVWAFLAFTRAGKAMRAVADNPDLARLKGIDPRRVAVWTVFVAAGLCGVGGMLIALDTSVDPLTGTRILLSVFAAAVLGGLGSIPGSVVGALAIGLAEELTVYALAPAYRTAVGFAVILAILTLRPAGLFGSRAA